MKVLQSMVKCFYPAHTKCVIKWLCGGAMSGIADTDVLHFNHLQKLSQPFLFFSWSMVEIVGVATVSHKTALLCVAEERIEQGVAATVCIIEKSCL